LGQAIFSNVLAGLDLDLSKPSFGPSHFTKVFVYWTWAVAVAVLRTCVEEALGGLMSPRLITDLDVWAP